MPDRRKKGGGKGRSTRSGPGAEASRPAGRRSDPAPVPRPHGTRPSQPVEVNGWRLYTWSAFRDRWDALVAAVEVLRRRDPHEYKRHPEARFLALLHKVVMEDIPRDPADIRYRQGRTMGGDYVHWRRAKFGGRFRLFFRYHSGARIIVYVWLNDESTLRKAGSRTDVYATFKAMLERDRPPSDWEALVEASESWAARPTPDGGDMER